MFADEGIMICLDEVQGALLEPLQPLQAAALGVAQRHYSEGYRAALQDLKTHLGDCGVWYQKIIPRVVLPPAATLRQQFARQSGASERAAMARRRAVGG